MKVFLTGLPGSGKSTVLMKAVEILREKGLKIGGIVTPEKRIGGKRIGFGVKDVWSGAEGILARVGKKVGPKVGKYTIYL
jgi:nucleoside-triphosphatase